MNWLRKRVWVPFVVALAFAGAFFFRMFGSRRRRKVLDKDERTQGYLEAVREQQERLDTKIDEIDETLEVNDFELEEITQNLRKVRASDLEDELNDAFRP